MKNATMKIVAILVIISATVGTAQASPSDTSMDLLIHKSNECSAPLIKLEVALDALSKAQDDYINVYASPGAAQETGRTALVKLESRKTDATILFYQLIGATPESIAKLEKAENVFNADLVDLLEPHNKITNADKSKFLERLHKNDLEHNKIEAIERKMNIALGIPPNAGLEDSIETPKHTTFISILSKKRDACVGEIRNKMKADN